MWLESLTLNGKENHYRIKRLFESERGTCTCVSPFSSGEQVGESEAEDRDWRGDQVKGRLLFEKKHG